MKKRIRVRSTSFKRHNSDSTFLQGEDSIGDGIFILSPYLTGIKHMTVKYRIINRS